MKHILTSLVFILSLVMGSNLAHAGSPVEGRWHTPKQEGTIEVKVDGGVLKGTLVGSEDKGAKLGTVILRDFVRSDNKWKGKIYAPKRGKVMDAELSLQNGKLVIKVSAGFRTKTIVWTKAS